jgi:hypothetical protein
MTVVPPRRPVNTQQSTKALRLQAIKTSDRLKKDYAVKRGKHLMQFVRDSAKEDLIALEESALILARNWIRRHRVCRRTRKRQH